MGSRAFIPAAVPEELIVTQTPAGVEAAAIHRSRAWAVVSRLVLFPLLLLPLALYAHSVTHTGEGLPPVDYARLLREPAAFSEILPAEGAFRLYAALPWILAVLLFGKHVFGVLRRPRLTLTAEGLTLFSSFPTSSSERVDIAAVTEVHIRDYMDGRGYKPQLMHFLALPAGEGMFDYLIGIEKSNDEGLRKLNAIAEAFARLHGKAVKHFDAEGKEEIKP
jgi:hypothetical protein